MLSRDPNYLVVSDLHLTLVVGQEDRATDDEFITFLEHYRACRVDHRPWRLIMAGDTFDFIYPDMLLFLQRYLPNSALRKTRTRWLGQLQQMRVEDIAWRLRVTMRERIRVFTALTDFLLAGNELVVIKGNHDVELQWELIRQTFLDTLIEIRQRSEAARAEDMEALRRRVFFNDWFYLEEGRLYVEHGNQYDEFNSWPDFLDPARVHDSERAFSPLGSRLTQYLTNAFVEHKPTPTNSSFMRYIVRSGHLFSYKFVSRSLTVMAHAVGNAGLFSEEGWRVGGGWEEQRLAQMEQQTGVKVDTLSRLRKLQATPATAIRGFFFNRMFLDRMFVVVLGVLILILALSLGGLSIKEPALLVAISIVPLVSIAAVFLRFKHRGWRTLLRWLTPTLLVGCCTGIPLLTGGGTLRGTLFVGWACLVISVSLVIMPLTEAIDLGSHLEDVAARIGKLVGVPLVIFGHHHRCVDQPAQERGGCRYINTGAWVNSGPEGNYAHVLLVRGQSGALEAALLQGRAYLDSSREKPHQ